MQKLYSLTLLLLLLPLLLCAQEYTTHIRHYNLEQGLKTRDLRYALKDQQGYLWFTSELGAYRFDGYEFKAYQRVHRGTKPYDMSRCTEDAYGNLWFEHIYVDGDGCILSVLPKGRDQLIPFEEWSKAGPQLANQTISKSHFDEQGNVWLITEEGAVYEFMGTGFEKILQLPVKAGRKFKRRQLYHITIAKDTVGHRWLTLEGQLMKLPVGSNELQFRDKLP
ncbi:MAG: hypothetical protein AAFO94_15585, partial [Bacteroidota bacterium]